MNGDRLLGVAQPFPIRRIGADKPRLRCQRPHGLNTLMFEAHQGAQTGALRIGVARGDSALIRVGAANRTANSRERALPGLGQQSLPEGGVVSAPAEKPKVVPHQSRGAIRGDHRRLDHQRSGAAHWIEELGAATGGLVPPGTQQYPCRQVLAQRRLPGFGAIAAAVQPLSRQVERQRDPLTHGVRDDAHRRARHRDVGPRARHRPATDRRYHP